MQSLTRTTSKEFASKMNGYPDFVRKKMRPLRELILETAKETDGVDHLEETLKWGEPSFLTGLGILRA